MAEESKDQEPWDKAGSEEGICWLDSSEEGANEGLSSREDSELGDSGAGPSAQEAKRRREERKRKPRALLMGKL